MSSGPLRPARRTRRLQDVDGELGPLAHTTSRLILEDEAKADAKRAGLAVRSRNVSGAPARRAQRMISARTYVRSAVRTGTGHRAPPAAMRPWGVAGRHVDVYRPRPPSAVLGDRCFSAGVSVWAAPAPPIRKPIMQSVQTRNTNRDM